MYHTLNEALYIDQAQGSYLLSDLSNQQLLFMLQFEGRDELYNSNIQGQDARASIAIVPQCCSLI